MPTEALRPRDGDGSPARSAPAVARERPAAAGRVTDPLQAAALAEGATLNGPAARSRTVAPGLVGPEVAQPGAPTTFVPDPVIVPDERAAPDDRWGPPLDDPVKLTRKERVAARRASQTRAKATVRHLDILTVARVSLIFYLILLVVVVVASVLLWYAANTFGTLPSMEKSIKSLFGLKSFTLHPTAVAKYTAAGGLVLAVTGTLGTILAALMYNLIADVVGGIRVEVDTYPTD